MAVAQVGFIVLSGDKRVNAKEETWSTLAEILLVLLPCFGLYSPQSIPRVSPQFHFMHIHVHTHLAKCKKSYLRRGTSTSANIFLVIIFVDAFLLVATAAIATYIYTQ